MTTRSPRGLAAVCVPLLALAACSSSPPDNPACTSDGACGPSAYCSAAGACVADAAAPSVIVAAPAPAAIVAGATVAISGAVDDASGSGVASVAVSLDGASFTPAALAGTAFTASLPAPDVDHTGATLTVRAVDRAGNAGTATVAFAIDRRAPALAIASPAEDGACSVASCTGATVDASAPAAIVFSGTVADAGGLAAADGLVGRVLAGDVVVAGPAAAIVAGEAWSFPWSVPATDGQGYRFELTATDTAGHATTRSRVVIVDRVAPVVSFTAPSAGQLLATESVTVSGQASDASSLGVTGAELSTDGATFAPLAVTGGQFTSAVPVPAGADHAPVAVTVRARDALGNVGSASVQFFGDRVAPAVAVTSPAADASCAPHAACSGAVASLATGATVTFQGTASDPSGLAAADGLTARVLDGGTAVATAALPAAGSWTFEWSSLPDDDGKEYVLEITATDAAGNARTASRRVWVDRVAPTATPLVSGDRLVPRTADLVTFSEEMDAAAVRSSSSFTPAARSTASYGTSDGRTFQLTDASGLAGYTHYTMAIGAGATDRAGNPVAPVTQSFLTETVPFVATTVEPVSSSVTPALPRLVVDSDGRPHVLYGDQNATSGTAPVLASWNGRATDAASFAKRTLTPAAWAGLRPAELVATGQTTNPDQTVTPRLEVLMRDDLDRAMSFGTSPDLATWTGVSGGAPDALGSAGASDAWALAPAQGCRAATCSSASIERRIVARSGTGNVTSLDAGPSGWSGSALLGTTSASAIQNGAAVLDGTDLRYFDPGGTTAIPAPAGTTAFAGAAQVLSVVRAGTVLRAERTGSGFLVAGFRVARTPFPGFRWALSIACSADPLAGTWRATETTVSSSTFNTIPVPAFAKIATALDATTFAAAAQIGTGSIHVVKAANGDCAAAPVVAVAAQAYTGRDPAVAVDGAGNVWLAYVSTAAGTDGDLVVTQVAFPP